MNQNMIPMLQQSGYKMSTSLLDEERHNGYKLMFSEDSECNILATEIFNSFGDSNFSYHTIMNGLFPSGLYRRY